MGSRSLAHPVLVHQVEGLLARQGLPSLVDLHPTQLGAPGQHTPEQVLELNPHLLYALRCHDGERGATRLVRELDLDLAIVELAEPQEAPQLLARLLAFAVLCGRGRHRGHPGRGGDGWGEQDVQHPLLRPLLGLGADSPLLLFGDHDHGQLHEVANDRLDIAPHVPHLGELGGLNLDEGRLGQSRQPARDLGLSDTGGTDHDDVLGRDLLAELFGYLLPAPTVSQLHRHCALGLALAHDVAIELGDDFTGCKAAQLFHGTVTTLMLSLV